MKGLKKVSCAVLAMAMAATMTGCDASWIAKSGDLKIPAGVYAATMLQNCTYGYAYGGADYLDETTEEEFVTYAKDYTIEILSYLKKAEELGISLDEEEMAELETAIDADWETYGNLYEANRISKDSLELSYEASLLSEKVFKAIYGEGGEKEVSEEELRTIFSEDYLKAGVILFNKPVEATLAEDATEEEKTAAKEEYETALKEVEEQVAYWIEQATNLMGSGSTFNEVMIAYEIENDPYTTEEIDTTSSRYTYINKNDTDLPEEVITRLEGADFGVLETVETDEYIVLCCRADQMADEADFESQRDVILYNLKYDEMNEYMDAYIETLDIEFNESAIKRFAADQMVLGY